MLLSYHEELAEVVHQNYLKLCKAQDAFDCTKPSNEEWRKLTSELKWSNRFQADGFVKRIRADGYELAKDVPVQVSVAFFDKEVELMAEAEHRRWWTEKLLAGWKKGPRDDGRKCHPDMIPYNDLEDANKE